jgi:hypothetical protein
MQLPAGIHCKAATLGHRQGRMGVHGPHGTRCRHTPHNAAYTCSMSTILRPVSLFKCHGVAGLRVVHMLLSKAVLPVVPHLAHGQAVRGGCALALHRVPEQAAVNSKCLFTSHVPSKQQTNHTDVVPLAQAAFCCDQAVPLLLLPTLLFELHATAPMMCVCQHYGSQSAER